MARLHQSPGFASLLFILMLLCRVMTGEATELVVTLEMPYFALRGSSITLVCNHDVQPEMLYKVEWRRAGRRIVQYIRERNPPFVHYSVQGAILNMSLMTERSIVLEELEFSASGSYSCDVSTETPIFTKSSQHRELLVIQPQKHLPKILFGASLFTLGDTLEATCNTSPAYPAPHITWMINGEKVNSTMIQSFVHIVYPPGHQYNNKLIGPTQLALKSSELYKFSKSRHDRRNTNIPHQVDESLTIPTTSNHRKIPGTHEFLASSTTKLSVAVSSLRLSAGRRLALTCLSTIPAYKFPTGHYADKTEHTVTVDVVVEEPETTTELLVLSSTSSSSAKSAGIIIHILVIYHIISTCQFFN